MSMARLAAPATWIVALSRQRGPLRLYQWLWLLVCALGALAAAAPRILSQPIRYETVATVQIDAVGRYHELYTDGQPDDDYRAVEMQAFELLRARRPDLGGPTYAVHFVPYPDGRVEIIATGRAPLEAQVVADEAAETLARAVRAAGGREILRNLMGWELTEALQGRQPETAFQRLLREIIRTQAFPLNRAVEPVSAYITVDQLPQEELSDLARALEVREEQLTRIDIPALEIRRTTATGATLQQIDADLLRLTAGRQAIREALAYLYRNLGAAFAPDAPGDAYRASRAPLPERAVDRRVPLLLSLATVVGVLFGAAGVAIDRSAGAMRKVLELWAYRELIRNLVLRDLQVRYKGSALGYFWTQLAPLLLMLVFWFVFSAFFQADIAMFPVFLLVGLLPWNFASEAVNGGARSVIDNAALVKKVFFPREVLPLVAVLSSLVNFVLSLPMLLLVMAAVQWMYAPLRAIGAWTNFSWTFVYLPVLIGIQTIFLAGVALFLSALAVRYRDTVHLIGIFIQFWFFLTPVIYALDRVAGPLAQLVRWLNPMASLIEFYREILYGNAVAFGQIPTPNLPALDSVLRVLLTAFATLAIGYWYFQRRSGEFGERL
ncbi:MAG: transport permease protein [Roseiflexus sp.]|nr:MAG: transport permease protein [Roseiflexus sp.]